jgi:hypothetical protein
MQYGIRGLMPTTISWNASSEGDDITRLNGDVGEFRLFKILPTTSLNHPVELIGLGARRKCNNIEEAQDLAKERLRQLFSRLLEETISDTLSAELAESPGLLDSFLAIAYYVRSNEGRVDMRVANGLKNAYRGVLPQSYTVHDLVTTKDLILLKMENFGRHSLQAMRATITEYLEYRKTNPMPEYIKKGIEGWQSKAY